MLADQLLSALLMKRVIGNIDGVEVLDIAYDSRKVKPGSLFLAIAGFKTDGHAYVAQAEQAGAVAAVVETEVPDVSIPQVVVANTRKAAPILAAAFFRHPTHSMRVIGVTGTNGKTTTTHLIDRILSDYGKNTGLIGTIKTRIGTEEAEASNTTPEAVDLQRIFSRMQDIGTEYPIMEVSSHALELGRVAGIRFHTAIFTNLTQDHLDFHKTMEDYRNAKSKLFERLGNTYPAEALEGPTAILNADDPASDYFARQTVAQIVTYGIDNPADIRADQISFEGGGVSFRMTTPAGEAAFKLQLTGKFSVYNAMAAAAACLLEGVPLASIKQSLEAVPGVDGRFERVLAGQDFQVIVDYAHTPDALENVLKTVRELCKGKVITVVGCGGDRDKTKRPIMAKLAADYSDFAVLTSDNPRTENPESILDDMEAGLGPDSRPKYVRIADRAKAIQYAVAGRDPLDVVLIAGKGHETYQEIGRTKYDFDDRVVASKAIRGIL